MTTLRNSSGYSRDAGFKLSPVENVGPRQSWARYTSPVSLSPYATTMGSISTGDRAEAAVAIADFVTSNPLAAAVLENLKALDIGTGIRPVVRIDWRALGMGETEGPDFVAGVEREFRLWWDSTEVSFGGDRNGSEILHDALVSYYLFGESFASLEAKRSRETPFLTRVSLLDPRCVDPVRHMMSADPTQPRTVQGLEFDGINGEWTAAYIYRSLPGVAASAMAQRVPVKTPSGRERLIHAFVRLFPSQVRGLSPLAAALTPLLEHAQLQELTVGNHALQNMLGFSLTSPAPAPEAASAFIVNDTASGASNPTTAAMQNRVEWHEELKARFTIAPSVVNVLAPGEKIETHQVTAGGSQYGAFAQNLARQVAAAAGLSYDAVTSDFSNTSFSAARMSAQLPYRLSVRRREAIAGKLIRSVFRAWMQEGVERGLIKLPASAKPFYAAQQAYCAIDIIGPAMVQPDSLKAAQTSAFLVANNLSTLAHEVQLSSGLDLLELLEARRSEEELLERYGLTLAEPEKAGPKKAASKMPAQEDHSEDGHEREG